MRPVTFEVLGNRNSKKRGLALRKDRGWWAVHFGAVNNGWVFTRFAEGVPVHDVFDALAPLFPCLHVYDTGPDGDTCVDTSSPVNADTAELAQWRRDVRKGVAP